MFHRLPLLRFAKQILLYLLLQLHTLNFLTLFRIFLVAIFLQAKVCLAQLFENQNFSLQVQFQKLRDFSRGAKFHRHKEAFLTARSRH